MRQNVRNAAIIAFIVALILLVSVAAVIIEQGSKIKVESNYFQDKKAVKQINAV